MWPSGNLWQKMQIYSLFKIIKPSNIEQVLLLLLRISGHVKKLFSRAKINVRWDLSVVTFDKPRMLLPLMDHCCTKFLPAWYRMRCSFGKVCRHSEKRTAHVCYCSFNNVFASNKLKFYGSKVLMTQFAFHSVQRRFCRFSGNACVVCCHAVILALIFKLEPILSIITNGLALIPSTSS